MTDRSETKVGRLIFSLERPDKKAFACTSESTAKPVNTMPSESTEEHFSRLSGRLPLLGEAWPEQRLRAARHTSFWAFSRL